MMEIIDLPNDILLMIFDVMSHELSSPLPYLYEHLDIHCSIGERSLDEVRMLLDQAEWPKQQSQFVNVRLFSRRIARDPFQLLTLRVKSMTLSWSDEIHTFWYQCALNITIYFCYIEENVLHKLN